jgi:hypothetical protein
MRRVGPFLLPVPGHPKQQVDRENKEDQTAALSAVDVEG